MCFNRWDDVLQMTLDLPRVGFYVPGMTYKLVDIWSKRTTTVSSDDTLRVTVGPHDTALFRLE